MPRVPAQRGRGGGGGGGRGVAPAAQPPAQAGVLPLPAGGSLPAALQQVQPRLIFTLFNLEEVQMKVFVEKKENIDKNPFTIVPQ